MIELIRIEPAGERALDLTFSDGSRGRWQAEAILARDTVLTRPLEDPAYFAGPLSRWGRWYSFAVFVLHKGLRAAIPLM